MVNPDDAANMTEGAVTDGIGNALYGEMTFKAGAAEKTNFDKYRIIRMSEAPKAIDVHFVKNEIAPTGIGEPPFRPSSGRWPMRQGSGLINHDFPRQNTTRFPPNNQEIHARRKPRHVHVFL